MLKFHPSKPYKFDPEKQYPAVLYANALYVEVDRNSRTVELVNARDNSLVICVSTSSEDTPLGFTKNIPKGVMEYLLKQIKDSNNGVRRLFEQSGSVHELPV